jgi:hypothetical protein
VEAITEGPLPNFNEAFTQLHLGQCLALVKYFSGDQPDGGIDPHTDKILWDGSSSLPCVDEDLLSIASIVRHYSSGGTPEARNPLMVLSAPQ